MNVHWLAIFALTALAVSGCHSRPEQRAVLDSYQNELRRYESIIYDLEYDNDVLSSENDRLKKRLAVDSPTRSGRVDEGPGIFSPRSTLTPRTAPRTTTPSAARPIPGPRDSILDEMDLSSPEIEVGPPPDKPPKLGPPATNKKPIAPESEPPSSPLLNDSSPDEPPLGVSPAPLPPKSILKPSPLPSAAELPDTKPDEALPAPIHQPISRPKIPELLPDPADKKVSQLFIDPQRTRGLEIDHMSGDDGLHIVLEPRNVIGEVVPATGKVSIVLLDPARQNEGEAARVGSWEFDPDLVRHQMRLSGKRNISLEVPWSNLPPQHSQLTMFVRMETDDGQHVESSRDISILLPGQQSSRWTPRPPQRRGPLNREIEVADKEGAVPHSVVPAAHAVKSPTGEASKEKVESASLLEWKPYR